MHLGVNLQEHWDEGVFGRFSYWINSGSHGVD